MGGDIYYHPYVELTDEILDKARAVVVTHSEDCADAVTLLMALGLLSYECDRLTSPI